VGKLIAGAQGKIFEPKHVETNFGRPNAIPSIIN
jgi:hypothetical protein